MTPPLHGVLETCLYVDDLEEATRFYEQVLGARPFMTEPERHVFTRIGNTLVFLFRAIATRNAHPPGNGLPVPVHGADGPGHVAFSIDPEHFENWRTHLAKVKVPIEEEIAWPNGARSLYFRDPAGNSLELATRTLWAHILDTDT